MLPNTYLFVFLLLAQFTTLASGDAVLVTEKLPWDTGKKYPIGWICYILTCVAGVVLNIFSLYLICFKKRVRGIRLASLIYMLNCVDFLMSFYCLLQCLLNFVSKQQYGHTSGCQTESVMLAFFEIWEAFTLALISYCLERKVCAGIEFPDKDIFSIVCISGLFSVFFAVCATYLPYGGFHLYSSGTFCFLDLSRPLAAAFFFVGVLLPTLMMVHRYLRIWKCVAAAQTVLAGKGMEIKAKASYSNMAKKMALFILTFFFCSAPFLISEVYELVTGVFTPPWLDVICAVFLHLTSVIDPILFFVFNEDVSEVLHEDFGIGIPFSQKKSRTQYNRIQIQPVQVHCDVENPVRNIKTCAAPTSLNSNVKEWQLWIENERLAKELLSWSQDNYVIENLLFYRDMIKFKELGSKAKDQFSCWYHDDPDKLCFPDELRQLWHGQLFELASRIYELFIDIPKAPLEINIPALTHNKILKTLGKTSDFKAIGKAGIPTFPDVWLLSEHEAIGIIQNITQVYDEAFKNVCVLIETDVFPRFKKTINL